MTTKLYDSTFFVYTFSVGSFYYFLLLSVKRDLFNNLFFRVIESEIYKILRDESKFKTKSKEIDQNF